VLTTNTDLPAREVALQYKQLWMVEDVFRSMKSLLDTRPIFHKCDETIRGHVFCSFLALLLRKELEDRLARKEWKLEWRRDPGSDNIIEMDSPISRQGYIFAARLPFVQTVLPVPCATVTPETSRTRARESFSSALVKDRRVSSSDFIERKTSSHPQLLVLQRHLTSR